MPDPTVRWGVLGAGPMAAAFVHAARTVPGAEVTAVATRHRETASAFAEAHGLAHALAGADDLVASSEVDVVYVATPNHLHAEHARLALAAGRPVVVEKPFARTAGEARSVVDLARERGLFCMEAMWTRFLPSLAKVRALVREGAIGDPRLLTAQLAHAFEPSSDGALWDPERGGGALLDLGPYVVALALDLLGPVAAVEATAATAASGVDDRVALSLRHTGGAVSSLAVGITAAGGNEAVVAGDRGHLRVHAPLYRPERVTLRRAAPIATGAAGSERGWRTAVREQPALRAVLRRLEPVRARARGDRTWTIAHAGSGYQYQVAEAVRCLRQGLTESPVMPLDDSVAVLDVLDRARASAQRSPG